MKANFRVEAGTDFPKSLLAPPGVNLFLIELGTYPEPGDLFFDFGVVVFLDVGVADEAEVNTLPVGGM